MKSFIHICCCFVLILSTMSCSKEEPITGAFQVRYYLSSYFVPQSINLSSNTGKGVSVINLDSKEKITKENNPTEFAKLSTEYGETGEKEFWTVHPPYSQPFGISMIKVYQFTKGKRIDISDKIIIGLRDCSNVILSKYSDMREKSFEKKISELTSHDLKWIRESFSIHNTIKKDGDFYLVITLKNGKELIQQLKN